MADTPKYSKEVVKCFIEYGEKQLAENMRYLSFDYCYGYFQKYKKKHTKLGENMEYSCMVLWSYLASWGMLRGSSLLLQEGNYKVLEETIKVIQKCFGGEIALPKIEDDSLEDYVEKVDNLCKEVRDSIKLDDFEPSNTLVTKIILGVFGAFPALDTNFCLAFGGGTSIRRFAEKVKKFYRDYNGLMTKEINVENFIGAKTEDKYPVEKLIDMFGFFLGGMVQGDNCAISIKNWNGEKVYVDGEEKTVGSDGIIKVDPGEYTVEIIFDDKAPVIWKNVKVSKEKSNDGD